MTTKTYAENYRQYKSKFFLTVEQTLPFTSSTNLIREVKSLSPKFKEIVSQFFTLYITHIRIDRPTLCYK